jgi:hypothetical protein
MPEDTSHPCPGCKARVRRQRLACPACWRRLPKDLRNAVNGSFYHRKTDPGAHRRALMAAVSWYRGNPREG